MIRAKLSNGKFLLGVDAENLRRLQGGKPIIVDLAEVGGHDEVLIMFGPTMKDIVRELEVVNGGPLPPAMPLPPKGKPS